MKITRRSALLGTAAAVSFAAPVSPWPEHLNRASDPLVALRARREHLRTTICNFPNTHEGDEQANALVHVLCDSEVQIMRTEAETLAGALVQVEQLCLWERDGVVIGGDEAVERLIEVLPERIARLAESPS